MALETLRNNFNKHEKFYISGILLLIISFTIFDIIEDWIEGASLGHIIPEVCTTFLLTFLCLYLFLLFTRTKQTDLKLANDQLSTISLKTKALEDQSEQFKKNISDIISKQLSEWSLSDSERDIAFLLIKGMSINEISEIRQTSTQTIRRQASVIYKKSGLAGRSQLAAYFLEDLL